MSPQGNEEGAQVGQGPSHQHLGNRLGWNAWCNASAVDPVCPVHSARTRPGRCCSCQWVLLATLFWSRIDGLTDLVEGLAHQCKVAECRIL